MRLFVLLTALLILLSGRSVAQTDGITILTPVTGDFAVIALEDVVIFNTQSGSVTTVEGTDRPISLSPIIWDHSGSRIIFADRNGDFSLYNIVSQQLINQLLPVSNSFYNVVGWSVDGNEIILLGFSEAVQVGVRTVTFYKYFFADNSMVPLASYTTNSETSAVPNLQGTIPYSLQSLRKFTRNPVFNDWVVGDYYSQDQVPNVIVQNLVTGQMTQISPMFGSAEILNTFAWSHTGEEILLTSYDLSGNDDFINIVSFDPNGTVSIHASTINTNDRTIVDWLGVEDLFITLSPTSTDDQAYFINQIIDNVLYEQPFLLLDKDTLYFSNFDFYLRADDDEQRQLSCIFDQALPTQLSLGTRARVNFTDGTPLRLRDAPSFDANEVTQMAEGTEFDIIGGKACVNADSYYRFWEVQLDDGTTGWAAEANLTDYFMEPAPVD